MKYAIGVTLTEDERRMVGLRDPFIGGGQTASGIVRTHSCAVTLPTGQSCSVGYARINASLHRFDFAAPLCQTVWHSGRVINGYAAIESKAQEATEQAFRQVQEAERKTMQRAKPPQGESESLPPQMSAKSAQAQSGYYALCHQSQSGSLLLPIGPLHAKPEGAQEAQRRKQAEAGATERGQYVVGICCRWKRRWQAAQWLAPLPEEAAPPETQLEQPANRGAAGTADKRPRRKKTEDSNKGE